jgi:bacillithiol synthase
VRSVTPSLEVRARIAARPEPPFERLYDPLVHELVAGGDFARARFPVLWSDDAALSNLAKAKLVPLPASLADALYEYHRRLGAPPASLAALDRMARGQAVCVVAGQQPAPLGGPLYSLHKTASAVGLAAVVEARTGVPCVPLFWTHGEDSDFAEIRGTTVVDRALGVHDLAIASSFHVENGLVGNIPVGAVADLHGHAAQHWEGLPAAGEATGLIARAASRARDLAELQSAVLLELYGARGLVVVDPRLAEFRDAARPILERYLERAQDLSRAANAAGDLLAARLGRRPLGDVALESFVFAINDGTRRKLTIDEARAAAKAGARLSPSVALRPVVQDGVFPTVGMACGAAEISYLAQLREVFEGLGVRAAAPVPRLTATWLPPSAIEMANAAAADPWQVVSSADAVLRELAERSVPREARAALDEARSAAFGGLEKFGPVAGRVEASLPQMVESARAKIDYQFARLLEGLQGKVRHQLERQHPEWARLRYALLPGDKLQERRIASLQPVAHRGVAVGAELADLAADHGRALATGRHEHYLLEMES